MTQSPGHILCACVRACVHAPLATNLALLPCPVSLFLSLLFHGSLCVCVRVYVRACVHALLATNLALLPCPVSLFLSLLFHGPLFLLVLLQLHLTLPFLLLSATTPTGKGDKTSKESVEIKKVGIIKVMYGCSQKYQTRTDTGIEGDTGMFWGILDMCGERNGEWRMMWCMGEWVEREG